MTSIGDFIRTRREALGLSAADLARALGVTGAAVSNWERQPDRAPSREHLNKLAELLQVRVEELLTPPSEAENSEEKGLVAIFRTLDAVERKVVIRMIMGLKKPR